MKTGRHNLFWNLPADYDETKARVILRFDFHAGNGRKDRHNPDPARVENLTVWLKAREITESLPNDVLWMAEGWVWANVDEKAAEAPK